MIEAWPSNIQLLVSLSDLKLVKSITGAIDAADIASGRGQPAAKIGPAPTDPRDQQPPQYEIPRRRFEPEPVIEPRRHIRPSPVYEPCVKICRPCRPAEPELIFVPAPPEGARATIFRLEPPWKSVPWKNPIPEPEFIKVVVKVNDNVHRGQMIDLFI